MRIIRNGKEVLDASVANINSIIYPVYDNGSKAADFEIDWSKGDAQKFISTGDATITFSGFPASEKYMALKLHIVDGGAHTLTWPNSLIIGLTISGTDIVVFTTIDAGTTISASVAALDI
jgi:hypothetical protein